jgi:hypothetical protein
MVFGNTEGNAYIETNLYGYAFCNAAWEAFETLLKNFVQIAAHNFVGKLVFFTLKLCVICLNLLIAYYMMTSQFDAMKTDSESEASTGSYTVPMILIAIMTYFIVSAFTELFEMTTDTILICFCEDKAHNDANKGTLLAPVSLQKALGLYKTNLKNVEANEQLVQDAEAEAPHGATADGLYPNLDGAAPVTKTTHM